jgi:hypothetical protein
VFIGSAGILPAFANAFSLRGSRTPEHAKANDVMAKQIRRFHLKIGEKWAPKEPKELVVEHGSVSQ